MRAPLVKGDAVYATGMGKLAHGTLTEHVELPGVQPMIRYRASYNKGEYLVPAKQVRRETNLVYKNRREK